MQRPQRLLWIGSPFFARALTDCGFEVCVHNFEHAAVFGWNDLVRVAGWEPDILVVADKSRPPFVLGMERFPCHTVFYGVDSHIHSWFPWYAQGFDLCLLSLRDDLESLRGRRLGDNRLFWSPAFAQDLPSPSAPPVPSETDKDYEVLFVGTVSANTPLRKHFLELLGARLPGLHVTRGNYKNLYPRAKIVLNICEHGDLNFRVFEALGCGACLVTPHVEHGFSSLFQDGVQLATYPPICPEAGQSVEAAVNGAESVIRRLLATPEKREALATEGLNAVNAGHRAIHRARGLAGLLRTLPPDAVRGRVADAENIRKRWLRFFYLLQAQAMPVQPLAEAYTAAAAGRFY